MCVLAGDVNIAEPHTTTYVYYMCPPIYVSSYMCMLAGDLNITEPVVNAYVDIYHTQVADYIRIHTYEYIAYLMPLFMCPHSPICVLIPLSMCPSTTLRWPTTCDCTCVLLLCVLILL